MLSVHPFFLAYTMTSEDEQWLIIFCSCSFLLNITAYEVGGFRRKER
jgi:hypothetical protein